MGMFDRIIAKCPICSKEMEFQTKSGQCDLSRYDLEQFASMEDPEAMLNVNRHSPKECCGKFWAVEFAYTPLKITHAKLIEVSAPSERP